MFAPSQLPHMTDRSTPAPLRRLPRRRGRLAAPEGDVAIRMAGPGDAPVLQQLQQLDAHDLPTGRHLIAELGGVPVAAIAVADETVVADPFVPTAGIADLLRVRARQLRFAS